MYNDDAVQTRELEKQNYILKCMNSNPECISLEDGTNERGSSFLTKKISISVGVESQTKQQQEEYKIIIRRSEWKRQPNVRYKDYLYTYVEGHSGKGDNEQKEENELTVMRAM